MRRRRPGRQRGTAGEREGGEGSDPLRLVLALGGRAALGAYVAGAVAELLDALERDPGADVRVHVIAGSSAGALTAALAARALTVNPGVVPWMRKLWVEALDADLLLEPGRAQPGALFDGAVIEELGRALIAADPAADDRRAPAAGDPLRLGFTLSNLSGVPLQPRARFLDAPERTARLPAHAGAAEFELRTDTRPDAPIWEAIRRAATASAAFPFVFPPQSIERPHSPGVEPRPDDGPARRMWYADGGLLGDGPLALARHLVGRSPDHGSARWLYIAVDPDLHDVVDLPPGAPDSPSRLAVALSRALLGGS
ncbi:MAG: patatin-like phospholipase family protein, partial [Gemmatimonadota bacterium]